MDEQQSMQYSDVAFVPATTTSRNSALTSRSLSALSTSYSRLSVASVGSHQSNETYIGVGELASAPQHHQHSLTVNEDVRHYLDLQPPLESEELYISSHFADEPLYQFYTAAIIEVCIIQLKYVNSEDNYIMVGTLNI